MAQANTSIGKTSCAVSITAGHHQLSAGEAPNWAERTSGRRCGV
jgi:hypothetical protein